MTHQHVIGLCQQVIDFHIQTFLNSSKKLSSTCPNGLCAQMLTATRIPMAGLTEDNKVQTPAFTDAVRLYRQAQGHYGTWEMMCGVPSQVSMAVHHLHCPLSLDLP